MDADIYPINPDIVKKGDTIDPWDHGMIDSPRGSVAAKLALLRKRDEIMQMMMRLHTPVSIVIRKEKLVVLTDSEAAEYHHHRAGHALTTIGRQSRNLRELIDRSKLPQEQADTHDRRVALWALRYAAASARPAVLDRQHPHGTSEIPRRLG